MSWPARTECIQMQIIPKNACNLPCLCLETQHKFQAASISEKAIAMQALKAIFKYWSELKMCLACCISVSLLRCSKTLSNDLVQHASWQGHVSCSIHFHGSLPRRPVWSIHNLSWPHSLYSYQPATNGSAARAERLNGSAIKKKKTPMCPKMADWVSSMGYS